MFHVGASTPAPPGLSCSTAGTKPLSTSAPMGVCGSMLMKPWRGAGIDRTALFLAAILVAETANCSGSCWREHGEIMWLNVDSMWCDVDIT